MTAYVIVDIGVTDPVRYEDYKTMAAPTIGVYGGRYVARGGATAARRTAGRPRSPVWSFWSLPMWNRRKNG